MKILVLGAGAIGCLMGGRLAQSGQDVTLVGRQSLVDAVAQGGVRLCQNGVVQHIGGVRAVTSTNSALWQASEDRNPFELALLTTKSYDTETALTELAGAAEANQQPIPVVLSMQNGVGNEEAIAVRFGADRVIAGVTTMPVIVPEPGVVQLPRVESSIGLAAWDFDQDRMTFRSAYEAFEQASFDVAIYPDARAMKWSKLLLNMMANATCAILGESPADVFDHPELANLEIDTLREALVVMRRIGLAPVDLGRYPLGRAALLLRMAPRFLLRPILRRLVDGARGKKMPSLYLDLERGKGKSEVGWLNGAVVRQGERIGVPTPVNRLLYETLHFLTQQPEEWSGWRGNDARLIERARVRLGAGG